VTTVERYDDPRAFRSVAEPFLMRDEARHNLQVGICRRLEVSSNAYGDEAPYLSVARDADEIVAVTIRTPPFELLVSTTRLAAVDAIADDVRERFAVLPGILATPETSAAFADAWSARSGQPAVVGMPQRIHRLTHPPAVPPVAGRYREASASDRGLLERWFEEFAAEALHDHPRDAMPQEVDRRLADPGAGFVMWEDREPVSFAGYGGQTPNGIRIGPVYTPPAHRGRGYASACVATLSGNLLRGGYRLCFLFTDLRNPTSNRLYERLGYEPVCDLREITFGEPLAGRAS
jgi:predicted GNAT family acetyltransferase